MAAALTLLSALPNSLKYIWSTDAAGSQTASRTKAQMLVDAATAGPGPSPLLAFLTPLTGAPGPTGWAEMDEQATGPNPRLEVVVRVKGSTNGICASAAFVALPGDQLDVTAQAGGGAIVAGDEIIVDVTLRNTLA